MHVNDEIISPRYEETDQMGVIYHGNYYTYFEVGRSSFFRSLGYSYKKLEEAGIILPVIESSCKYIKPALYDVEIIVRTRVECIKGVKLCFLYNILNKETEELLAEGRTMHVFADRNLKLKRPKHFSEEVKAMFEKF